MSDQAQPTQIRDRLPVSKLFSAEVRDALLRASATPGGEFARTIAINKAMEFARSRHPELFK